MVSTEPLNVAQASSTRPNEQSDARTAVRNGACASYRCSDLPEGSGIFASSDQLSRATCDEIVRSAEQMFFQESAVGSGRGPVRLNPNIRRSKEVQLPAELGIPASRTLAKLAPRLRDTFDSPIGFATAPILLRYQQGDFFAPHQDNTRTPGDRQFRTLRIATYIYYLTSHVDAGKPGTVFDGGRLFLYRDFNPLAVEARSPRKFALVPAAGDLVVFPSAMYHEAEPISSGIRYCLLGWLFTSKPSDDNYEKEFNT